MMKEEGTKMAKQTAVIIGAGPGLGYSLAETFGSKGFRVVLLARNAQRLKSFKRIWKQTALKHSFVLRM